MITFSFHELTFLSRVTCSDTINTPVYLQRSRQGWMLGLHNTPGTRLAILVILWQAFNIISNIMSPIKLDSPGSSSPPLELQQSQVRSDGSSMAVKDVATFLRTVDFSARVSAGMQRSLLDVVDSDVTAFHFDHRNTRINGERTNTRRLISIILSYVLQTSPSIERACRACGRSDLS